MLGICIAMLALQWHVERSLKLWVKQKFLVRHTFVTAETKWLTKSMIQNLNLTCALYVGRSLMKKSVSLYTWVCKQPWRMWSVRNAVRSSWQQNSQIVTWKYALQVAPIHATSVRRHTHVHLSCFHTKCTYRYEDTCSSKNY